MEEFEYEEVVRATGSFSTRSLIGKGSHGCVYKATLADNRVVAVKTPSPAATRTLYEPSISYLANEVCILSSLAAANHDDDDGVGHLHVIKLLGTCHDHSSSSSNNKNKLLVMEYMPNGSLDDLLHRPAISSTVPPIMTTWPARVQIAFQVACALRYLHEGRKPVDSWATPIIHRDIKSANVLFDSDWNAKLADFGLAVMVPVMTDEYYCSSSDNYEYNRIKLSGVINRPAGTIGYMDPGYTCPSKLSIKNDVFSYGVVLLEILSGRKAMDVSKETCSIVEWAVLLTEQKRAMDICDPRLSLPRVLWPSFMQMVSIARRCVSPDQASRPTMSEVVAHMEQIYGHRHQLVRACPTWVRWSVIFLKRLRKLAQNYHTASISNSRSMVTMV